MTDILIENVTMSVNGYSPYISDGTDGFTHGNWITWNGASWIDSTVASTILKTYATDPANISNETTHQADEQSLTADVESVGRY